MREKLTVVQIGQAHLENIVFLGDSKLNNIEYKRIEVNCLIPSEKEKTVCLETCGCRPSSDGTYPCIGQNKPCMWAVVRRTPSELEIRKKELKRLYPLTQF